MESRREVYRTGIGRVRTCARCGRPEGACECAPRTEQPAATHPGAPRDGVVRLARDRKGRGGKVVTLVLGLPEDPALLARIAQELKKFCGSGGTVRDGVIEIQGEHRERLAPKLVALGHRVKIIGG